MLTGRSWRPPDARPATRPAPKRKLQEQEGDAREARKCLARLPGLELDQRLDSLKVGLARDSTSVFHSVLGQLVEQGPQDPTGRGTTGSVSLSSKLLPIGPLDKSPL